MSVGIYKHELSILLDQGSFTLDELVKRSVERYEFTQEKARTHLKLAAEYHNVPFVNNKYVKTKDFVDPLEIIKFFEKMPDTYFDTRPGLYILYADCRTKAKLL